MMIRDGNERRCDAECIRDEVDSVDVECDVSNDYDVMVWGVTAKDWMVMTMNVL